MMFTSKGSRTRWPLPFDPWDRTIRPPSEDVGAVNPCSEASLYGRSLANQSQEADRSEVTAGKM